MTLKFALNILGAILMIFGSIIFFTGEHKIGYAFVLMGAANIFLGA